LNPTVKVVATAREGENAHLLRQGGADSVVISDEAIGRLLGLATYSPHVVEVIEDLISLGAGLDIVERPVRLEEVGSTPTVWPAASWSRWCARAACCTSTRTPPPVSSPATAW
jgi:voltage-gated potassium channel